MSDPISFWYVAGKREGMKGGEILSRHDTKEQAIQEANRLLPDRSYLYLKIGKEYIA